MNKLRIARKLAALGLLTGGPLLYAVSSAAGSIQTFCRSFVFTFNGVESSKSCSGVSATALGIVTSAGHKAAAVNLTDGSTSSCTNGFVRADVTGYKQFGSSSTEVLDCWAADESANGSSVATPSDGTCDPANVGLKIGLHCVHPCNPGCFLVGGDQCLCGI